MRGTALEIEYLEKRYTPPTLTEYCKAVAYVLSRIPSTTVIHRLTGDCPRDALVAPEWNRDKNAILDGIREEIRRTRGE